jgi:omega-6 fatty acid desaturase (delta-12 desaturase)
MVLSPPLVVDASDASDLSAAPLLSGLQGKALDLAQLDVPSKSEVRAVIPDPCFRRDTRRSLGHLAQSGLLTAICAAAGALTIPMRPAALPLWLLYAVVTGTVAMGLWVLAHECGHGAFSDNRRLQDAIGYALHTALLVPYYSWQRSHAVHHAHTNHVTRGETHVPIVLGGGPAVDTPAGAQAVAIGRSLGHVPHGALQLFGHLSIGWPAYLLAGVSGGCAWHSPRPGNHFWPSAPFSPALWPGRWARKVLHSSAGIAAVLGMLCLAAARFGGWRVAALYLAPLLVVNAWLVTYTWLQHTDVDVPHLDDEAFSYMRGAFLTIDRPYPPLIDWLHHRIGTTHVAHHIDCTIPHYHAREATEATKRAFPHCYLYEPTPIHRALWRVACNCVATRPIGGGRYAFIPM